MGKKYEGYHEISTLPVKKGDEVTIVAGTTIKTTNPKYNETPLIARRTRKIKVHHLMPGMTITSATCHYNHGETPGHKQDPGVVWVGAGGYWHEVNINDLTEIKNLPEPSHPETSMT